MFKKRVKAKNIAIFIALFFSNHAVAIEPLPNLPGSVQPGVVSTEMRQGREAQESATKSAETPAPEKPAPSALGEEAKKIKFKLQKIILEDNTVYTNAQLEALYKEKLDKVITVAELQDIVQSITNYYRNNGYILSRAIIPPQHVKGGVVHIRVVEGYIANVKVIDHPKGAKKIATVYAENILKSKPLRVKDLERNLFIINEVPGVSSKAVLEPSKKQTGASDLNLPVTTQNFNGYFSYDNYGTRYIGPQQLTGNLGVNSIFVSGDTTHATYVTTPEGNSLQYRDANYEFPIGSNGMRFNLDANQAITNPLYLLQILKIAGNAKNLNGTLTYPYIRNRSENMSFVAGFNYLDSYVTALYQQLYTDHVRSIKGGFNYDFADKYRGSNFINANLVQGLPILGGTSNNQSFFTSRYGATTRYTRINGQISRLQQLFWKFTLYGLLKGQYSFEPLLSSEQFAYGGSVLGRGYDPAELIGDRGAAASLELRADFSPQKFYVQALQLYAFYDAGMTWNLRNVQTLTTKMDATSTGLGFRFGMTKYVSGNFMYTQPLSKKVAALTPIGRGSAPRMFFSVVVIQ